jgi:hypothetical protein
MQVAQHGSIVFYYHKNVVIKMLIFSYICHILKCLSLQTEGVYDPRQLNLGRNTGLPKLCR